MVVQVARYEWNKKKKPCHTKSCHIKFVENYFFLENYVTSVEGAVSQNVLYYQPLSITRYQEGFMLINIFELLPIVSTAFKTSLISS